VHRLSQVEQDGALVGSLNATLKGFLLMRRLGLGQFLVQLQHRLDQSDHLVMPRLAAVIESGD
jgi:hypothetical protein